MRRTGFELIGNVPWGTHFCQFYKTRQDLTDILVPYFRQGLLDNEFCMWITSEPLGVEEARTALKAAQPDLDNRIAKGQIEILDYKQWYTKSGAFCADEVLQGWVDKLHAALAKGFEGLRLTGNTFWLEKSDWKVFTDYEEQVNNVIGRYQMIAACTYSLDKCGGAEIIDVVKNHQFALIKKEGSWIVVESNDHEKALRESEARLQQALGVSHSFTFEWRPGTDEVLRSASCGGILGFIGDQIRHDTGRNYFQRIHHDDRARFVQMLRGLTPAASTYTTEYRLERGDGSIVMLEELGQAVFDDAGQLARLVGVTTDITARKNAETALRQSEEKYRNLFNNMAEEVHFWKVMRDEAGRIKTWCLVDVNSAALKTWGRNSVEEIRGKTTDEIFGPGAVEHYMPVVQKIMTEGVPHSYEDYFPNLDKHFRFTSVPLGDYFITTGADITRVKKVEEALRISNNELNEFNQAMIGRELRMIELKREINALCARLGQLPPYTDDDEEAQP